MNEIRTFTMIPLIESNTRLVRKLILEVFILSCPFKKCLVNINYIIASYSKITKNKWNKEYPKVYAYTFTRVQFFFIYL